MTDLIARIHQRCIECADCLVWQGHSLAGKHPQMKVKGKVLYVRRVLYEIQHGEIPAGRVVAVTCETRNCVVHIAARTISDVQTRLGAAGVYSGVARRAKIAATKRAACSPITMEQALDIRYGSGTLDEAAARHGISKSSAGYIRRGERWKDYSNPFAQLCAQAGVVQPTEGAMT